MCFTGQERSNRWLTRKRQDLIIKMVIISHFLMCMRRGSRMTLLLIGALRTMCKIDHSEELSTQKSSSARSLIVFISLSKVAPVNQGSLAMTLFVRRSQRASSTTLVARTQPRVSDRLLTTNRSTYTPHRQYSTGILSG